MERYEAGLLSDFGGGNVDWWQDYIRAELERAEGFYTSEHDRLMAEKDAEIERLRGALRLYAKVGSWLLNGPCDPDGPNFIGLEHAEIALGDDNE